MSCSMYQLQMLNLDVFEEGLEEQQVFRELAAQCRATRDKADRPSLLQSIQTAR